MPNSDPLVSIITPVFNGRAFLQETLESLVRQTYQNLELIVVDDGSTDGSADLAAEVLEKSSRRYLVHRKSNTGEADSDNVGLQMSTGEYVAFINADDPVHPELIAESIKVFELSPEVVVTYPNWRMVDENGSVLRHIIPEDYSIEALIGDMLCLPGPGAVIRKSAFKGSIARRPDYRYTSDYRQWLTLSTMGDFKRINKELADWRTHSAQQTNTAGSSAMAGEFARIMPEFFETPNLPRSIKKLKRQAISTGYYRAAIQGMKSSETPSVSFALRSLMTPFVRRRNTQRQAKVHRRSIATFAMIFASPIGRALSWRQNTN